MSKLGTAERGGQRDSEGQKASVGGSLWVKRPPSFHICINTSACVSVCTSVLFLWGGGCQGKRNTRLIKSHGTEMDVPTHTHTQTHSPENPLLRRAVMWIVYLCNHLPFILSLPLCLGKPVMIITEYMENGSLDAFLRVSHVPSCVLRSPSPCNVVHQTCLLPLLPNTRDSVRRRRTTVASQSSSWSGSSAASHRA